MYRARKLQVKAARLLLNVAVKFLLAFALAVALLWPLQEALEHVCFAADNKDKARLSYFRF